MDVCQHAWLCFTNVLIADIKPRQTIHLSTKMLLAHGVRKKKTVE